MRSLIRFSISFRVQLYGMTKHRDLFTPRQRGALITLSELVCEAQEQAYQEALATGPLDDNVPLRDGGIGAKAYAEAISIFLTFATDKVADRNSVLTSWAN